MRSDFAVFILSHGRPKSVHTYRTLKRLGYLGKIYLLIDDEDAAAAEYVKLYGDMVLTFNKREWIKKTDSGDNFKEHRAVVYARNANFKIAKDMGLKYFLQLDDDYSYFCYRMTNELRYSFHICRNLDSIFNLMVEFLSSTPTDCIAFAQDGDFIGGHLGTFGKKIKFTRKVMNSFFCKTDAPFSFVGKLNEDLTTSVVNGGRGGIFFTSTMASLKQTATQQAEGGLTDIYLSFGTYTKSFYSVMYAPSCIKVKLLNTKHKRLHHSVSWGNAVPKIIKASVRK